MRNQASQRKVSCRVCSRKNNRLNRIVKERKITWVFSARRK